MIRLTQGLIRRWLDTLLHINDTPERTAAAFALGVFLGFSPFLGFHTVLGILLAFLFSLNRVAVLIGVYSNLPWVIAWYYASATMVGAAILRTRFPPEFGERLGELFHLSAVHGEFWREMGRLLWPLFWPYMIGSLLCSAVIAGIAYPVALAFVRRRRRRRLQSHL
jgi:uncharacterized protein (DUF2062 family)